MKYQIKFGSGLPVPESKRGRIFRFPFDRLEVGESFVILGMKYNCLSPYRKYAELRLGRKFVTRLIRGEKNKPIGTGVWRVK